MWRRSYFIVPDETYAGKLLGDLQQLGLGRTCVHAIAGNGVTLRRLPAATKRQAHSFLGRL